MLVSSNSVDLFLLYVVPMYFAKCEKCFSGVLDLCSSEN